MNPKPNKKLSLGAGFYLTIAWKGFFTQSQVLLSSILGSNPFFLTVSVNQGFKGYSNLLLNEPVEWSSLCTVLHLQILVEDQV